MVSELETPKLDGLVLKMNMSAMFGLRSYGRQTEQQGSCDNLLWSSGRQDTFRLIARTEPPFSSPSNVDPPRKSIVQMGTRARSLRRPCPATLGVT